MVMAAVLLGAILLEGSCVVSAHSAQSTPLRTEPDPYILPQPPQPPLPSPTSPPTSPSTTKPAETRGKYSNPYDRRIPLQGDTHKGYAPARRAPFKR